MKSKTANRANGANGVNWVNRVNLARWGLLAAAALLILAGLLGGQHIQVMQKAVRICLECIGIG